MANFTEFRRYPRDGWIAGVCAGIGVYMGWNIRLIRVVVFATFLLTGWFPIICAYAVLWYVMERDRGRLPERGGSLGYVPTPSPAPAGTPGSGAARTIGDVRSRFTRMEERLRSLEACVSSSDYELRRELRKLEG